MAAAAVGPAIPKRCIPPRATNAIMATPMMMEEMVGTTMINWIKQLPSRCQEVAHILKY
jgi:hypothetical protein